MNFKSISPFAAKAGNIPLKKGLVLTSGRMIKPKIGRRLIKIITNENINTNDKDYLELLQEQAKGYKFKADVYCDRAERYATNGAIEKASIYFDMAKTFYNYLHQMEKEMHKVSTEILEKGGEF